MKLYIIFSYIIALFNDFFEEKTLGACKIWCRIDWAYSRSLTSKTLAAKSALLGRGQDKTNFKKTLFWFPCFSINKMSLFSPFEDYNDPRRHVSSLFDGHVYLPVENLIQNIQINITDRITWTQKSTLKPKGMQNMLL